MANPGRWFLHQLGLGPLVQFGVRFNLKYVPGSKLLVLGMVIPPLIGNPYNGYINPYVIGLMRLSPIIWKQWELIDPGTYETPKSPYLIDFGSDGMWL